MKPISEYLKDVYHTGMPKVVKTEAEWKKLLPPETYAIAREAGTERAFCGAFYDHKKEGIYLCVCCELPLFASNAKFDSGTGWPSFTRPVEQDRIVQKVDRKYGITRVEVRSRDGDSHLGHVFEDGPAPTGLVSRVEKGNSSSETPFQRCIGRMPSVVRPRKGAYGFASVKRTVC